MIVLFLLLLLVVTPAWAGFPTTPVLDTFNRTDENPLTTTTWTATVFAGDVTLAISSNVAAGTGTDNGNYWNVKTFQNCEVYTTITTKAGNGAGPQLYWRTVQHGAGLDGYVMTQRTAAGTDTLQVLRIDNSSVTQLGATISQEITNGDSIGVRMIGPTIEVWYRSGSGAWTLLTTRSDTTYTAAGNIAAGGNGTVWRIDNFGGGNFRGGGAPMIFP